MKAKKILKNISLDKKWTKVELKKFNDFYLTAIKSNKASKHDTLDKDCVQKIRFEIAIEGGKKGDMFTINYLNLNFNDVCSSDTVLNKISALVKVAGYPSTFYIRPIDMTGERSVATEGRTSITVYLNEVRMK